MPSFGGLGGPVVQSSTLRKEEDVQLARHQVLLDKIDYALQVKPQQRWAARHIANVLQKYHSRMANLVMVAFIRTGMIRASEEKEVQLRGIVRAILVRKAQAFGLHVFTFCRRLTLDLLFQGLHTWRHYSLKRTMVEDQARLMNLLQCSQLEVEQYLTQVVDVKVFDSAEQENQMLLRNVRNVCHVHRCIIMVERALRRSLRSALYQLQSYKNTMQRRNCCAAPCLKSVLVSLVHQRLHWAWRRWGVAIEAQVSGKALHGALEMYDIPFAGLAAMRQVASADRATLFGSSGSSHRMIENQSEAFTTYTTEYSQLSPAAVSSNSIVAAMRSLMLESLSDQEVHDSSGAGAYEAFYMDAMGNGTSTGQTQDRSSRFGSRSQRQHLRAVHVLSAVLHRVLARCWHETWTQLVTVLARRQFTMARPLSSSLASSEHWLPSSGSPEAGSRHPAHPAMMQVTQPNLQSRHRSPAQKPSEEVQSDRTESPQDSKMGRIEAGLARLANAVGTRFASTPTKQTKTWSPATTWTPGPAPSTARFRA